ncbi:MAG: protein kinase [Deltaproteobacteria bacterium]|nr:MAG: protein kinase [Deltaproteobacteria bacterium]
MARSKSATIAASILAAVFFVALASPDAGAQSATGGREQAQPEPARAPGDADARLPELARHPMVQRLVELGQRVEGALLSAKNALPESIQRPIDRWTARTTSRGAWLRALYVVGGLLALLLGIVFVRGRGDLVVTLEYPPELRGTFSVRIADRKGRFKRQARGDRVQTGRTSTATAHYMVSRETQFRGIRSGRWFVTVEGVIQDPNTLDVIADHFEERPIFVRRRGTALREFDFRPKQCPITVRVVRNGAPVAEAAVAARGLPLSHRYARDGVANLPLQPGSHHIVVGAEDRVAEVPLEVDSYQPTSVEVDLGDPEHLLFTNCPDAVQPYLQAEFNAAAQALEQSDQTQVASLLLARLHDEQGEASTAAEHFESAGRSLEAAERWAAQRQFDRAARSFEQAGEPVRAAEMYRAAGQLLRAGNAFEGARDFERAAECYREAGDVPKWVGAVERSGAVFEAAKIAIEHGLRPVATRVLQTVPRDDPHFVEACDLLVDIYEEEGQFDHAAAKLQERISTGGDAVEIAQRIARVADLWERAEEFSRAIDALEALRRSQPSFPNLTTRIEELKKKLTVQQHAASGATTATRVPDGFAREGRYELLEEIGRGGMGVVFKARDQRLSRVVALKRLPENLRDHPKAVKLFLREAQAAAGLNHTNIVTVYDADEVEGIFFITMELLEGFPLNAILSKRGRLRVRDTARLAVQIAAGLQYAHSRRVVHRDIKTANLFFTKEKVVKIMDFGLAKMIEEVRRASTIVGGTPYYMAPEQSMGEAVDHRADIYAFGVTLFELLSGQVPFPEGDVAYHHRHTPAPDLREQIQDLPDGLAEIIQRMMAKRPDDRFSSAAEVAELLEPFTRQPATS